MLDEGAQLSEERELAGGLDPLLPNAVCVVAVDGDVLVPPVTQHRHAVVAEELDRALSFR